MCLPSTETGDTIPSAINVHQSNAGWRVVLAIGGEWAGRYPAGLEPTGSLHMRCIIAIHVDALYACIYMKMLFA
jgi:hypothetical protein